MLREQALTRDSLFHAIDERRCKGWFVRIEVPGMHARRVGPFTTQQKALDCYEEFLDGVMQAFVNFKMRWRTPRPMWWKGFRG